MPASRDRERTVELPSKTPSSDTHFGATHNKPGVLLMNYGEFYGAASEFEYLISV